MDFYHPLAQQGQNITPTYSADGEVKLPGASGSLYAMKAGTVVSIDNGQCIIKSSGSDNNLGVDLYIRYFPIGIKVNLNDEVTQGANIGDVNTGNADNGNEFKVGIYGNQECTDALIGNVDLTNNTFTLQSGGDAKQIIEECNLTNAKTYGNDKYSYCALIFASKFEIRYSGSGGGSIDESKTGNDYMAAANEYAKTKGGVWAQEFSNKIGNNGNILGAAAAIVNGCVRQGSTPQTGCCIAANAIHENIGHCLVENNSSSTLISEYKNNCTWGISLADGGHDCGFCSFHDPPDAYNRKVSQLIINPYVIPSGKFTEAEYGRDSKTTLDCQCFIYVGIMNIKCTTYSISRSGRDNDSDYSLVQQSGLDAFFQQHPNDVEKGTDIMLYLFERASNDSAGSRGKLGDILAHAFGILK